MSPLKSPYDCRLNKPYLTPILDIITESPKVKSFIINYDPINEPIQFFPGQFVMVWVPGIDEIPMSISQIGPLNRIRISVAAVGDATNALHQLQIGEKIGIRGPYGTHFQLNPGIAVILGGGIGMASVMPLIYSVITSPPKTIKNFIIIEGCKTQSELLFVKEIEDILHSHSNLPPLHICTDDGTCGFKGFTTDKLDELFKSELDLLLKTSRSRPQITVYACGPEKMLKKVFDLCEQHGIQTQLSLERIMRCGFGTCGLCALEPTGLLVCRDGPIFTSADLSKVTDFGKIHRDFSGKIIPL
jgi:dihydroorotate dehydrogenase electron transfer subunit